jgi:hypothetical protein
MSCPHTGEFEAMVTFNTFTDSDDQPEGWIVHLEVKCAECNQRFGFRSRDGLTHPTMTVEMAPLQRDGVPDVAH